MKIAYGITTAPRKLETLSGTLRSLSAAGFEDPYIFAEPETEVSCPDGRLFMNGQTLGPWPNLVSSLSRLLQLEPDADAIAVFQDDIKMTAGLRGWLEGPNGLWPESPAKIGIVSLYSAGSIQQVYRSGHGDGWFRLPDRVIPQKTFGACAYVLPRSSAQRLAEEFPYRDKFKTSDLLAGRWCKGCGLSYWQHSPSFVEHVGRVSSLSPRIDMGLHRTAGNMILEIPSIQS